MTGSFGERAAELAGFAAALLGWSAEEFWRATPAEMATALGAGLAGDAALDRGSLDRLRARFPDNRET